MYDIAPHDAPYPSQTPCSSSLPLSPSVASPLPSPPGLPSPAFFSCSMASAHHHFEAAHDAHHSEAASSPPVPSRLPSMYDIAPHDAPHPSQTPRSSSLPLSPS